MKQFLIIFVIIMIAAIIYSMITLNEYDETITRIDRKIELTEGGR